MRNHSDVASLRSELGCYVQERSPGLHNSSTCTRFTELNWAVSYSGLCSCNHLTKINDCGFGVILQACLVSKLQGPLSLGLKLSAIFQSFDLSKIFSLSQGISTPSLVQIGRHVRSQAICEDTHT
jgi:hypothetical protein